MSPHNSGVKSLGITYDPQLADMERSPREGPIRPGPIRPGPIHGAPHTSTLFLPHPCPSKVEISATKCSPHFRSPASVFVLCTDFFFFFLPHLLLACHTRTQQISTLFGELRHRRIVCYKSLTASLRYDPASTQHTKAKKKK